MRNWTRPALLATSLLAAALGAAARADSGDRKALVLGYATPEGNHPLNAWRNFLAGVGNPTNGPAGWTADFSWDLMRRLGLNPTNTPDEVLFNYIGRHHLGYRIVIACGPQGNTLPFWGCAADNGMMPFAPQGNNSRGYRFEDAIGLRSAVAVAGGATENYTSYGPGVEFIEDDVQSWANQKVAAKFARVLDAHPGYNIWDARQHLRQAASGWAAGWNETNGYGRVNEAAPVGRLLPGPPVDFTVLKSRDRHAVIFTWHNFLQTDFAATVIARGDGRILYDSTGTNLVWNSDHNGQETFRYWSRNRAGEISRLESYQTRTVTALECGPRRTCLVLGVPGVDQELTWNMATLFQDVASNWVCDVVMLKGVPPFDQVPSFPVGQVVAVCANYPAMVNYAITNHYRLLLTPATLPEGDRDLYQFKADWDRATAAGVLVVLPHNASLSRSRRPAARRLSPPRLFSALTVGAGTTHNLLSFGPGLEVYDAPPVIDPGRPLSQNQAAAVVAGKLAAILDANPSYNLWDARQHLRQTASHYASGWDEDGGYGRPSAQPISLRQLDPAPPVDVQAGKGAGNSVVFTWQNFLETSFAETIIQDENGHQLYHGTGTRFVWKGKSTPQQVFSFFSRDKSGRLSRPAVCPLPPAAGS